jgi:hypothetical protein
LGKSSRVLGEEGDIIITLSSEKKKQEAKPPCVIVAWRYLYLVRTIEDSDRDPKLLDSTA